MEKTLVLGNIITVDERRPFAEAAVVKNGVFSYVGTAEEAKKIAGPDARVLDYGANFIYPGFLESHCHPYFAGDRIVGQAHLAEVGLADYAKYREIIKDFIARNPERSYYVASGWNETEEYVSKAYLDEICSDKILIMQTGGGHSMLLNSKALEWAGIDAEYARKVGYAQVHVDKNGEPDGYICETPVLQVINNLPKSMEDAKKYLLAWQDFALSSGFTGVADAGLELFYPECAQAFHELEEEGKLKLRTYAYALSPDNVEDPKAEVARAAELRARYDSDYLHIVGIKCFLDGVTEAHTGWQNQDYADQPGYHGVERFNDHDKMVQLIVEADKEGLAVHCHSEGGGATHFMLGCIEDALKITGDKKQNNVLAHLHFVTEEDIRRMAETGSVPAVAPLWVTKIPAAFAIESSYVGEALANKAYPIKSFFDAGANVVFHSDYPVSPMMNVKLSFYMAEARNIPEDLFPGLGAMPLNPSEAITREQSLRAMTINVARTWHQEHRVGSIEFGKIANMTVYDCDFLHDDLEKVAEAKLVATVVDGEEVYKNNK